MKTSKNSTTPEITFTSNPSTEDLRGKHLLIDADILIDVLKLNAITQFQSLIKELEIVPCIIPPVKLEIWNTNNREDLRALPKLIDNFLIELPLTKKEIDLTYKVQIFSRNLKKKPSVTDYFISGVAMCYSDRLLILTGNLCDFSPTLFSVQKNLEISNSETRKSAYILAPKMSRKEFEARLK